ncbi:MAG: polysaccharide deacetylase family protein, partial [Coriobacteriia bacterium]|nr:polysaccharide deacetylase family protein [Coriobacteriia bacterium]
VSGIGWQGWKSGGAVAGTTGQSRQIEAVEMRLTGELEANFDIYYRAHIPNIGWLGWASNSGTAGTTGLSCRVEALQVTLVPKGGKAPGSLDNPYLTITCTAQGNVTDKGWLKQVTGRGVIGTTGQSRQLEAFKITADSGVTGGVSGGITYRAHVVDTGWQGWVADGAVAGTEGEDKYVEAIQIKLTGDLARYFDVYYRAHCSGIGWMGWAKNGASAGTAKLGLPMEAFEIAFVIKGTAAPGSTAQPYTDTKRIRDLDPKKPMIALTFDDGPGAYTTQLLNLLDRYDARATFFVIGSNANRYPGIIRDAYLRGNEIAGHSMTHQDYTFLSYGAVQTDITNTNKAIRNATGFQPPPFIRVPGGSFNLNVRNAAAGTGHAIIQWNVDPRDWEYRNANTVYSNVMNNAKPGSIVVLHDIHPTTVTAMERVIPDLIARGYQIVTVSELMYYSNRTLTPGQVYNSG